MWLIPIALLFAGCALWNVPLSIFWEIVLLLWFGVAPGYALAQLVRSEATTSSQQAVISFALGTGISVLVTVIMQLVGAREYSALTISILTTLSLIWTAIRERSTPRRVNNETELVALALISSVCCLIAIVYNFSSFHFSDEGALTMRGLFAIDLPYLIGNMPSLDLFGKMHDMHQNGLWFPYHDHVYRAISVAHQVEGSDYLSLVAYSYPIFGSTFAVFSFFSVFRIFVGVRGSLLAAFATLLISSSWGDHILTGALSPSYLGGIAYAAAIILLIRQLNQAETRGRSVGICILLGLCLGALAKTKLPLFAILGGSLGTLGLFYFRKYVRTSSLILSACLLSLIFAAVSSGSSPYQPSNDFVIGAPLQGYANNLASIVGVAPSDVDAIIQPAHLEATDLLFVPYLVIHFLRMILLDARLLLFVLSLIVTRDAMSEPEKLVRLFGITASVLGIILPCIYSPAWYPLAISFYTPEIAGMIALACGLILLIPRWNSLGFKRIRSAIVLCAVYGVLSTGLHILEQSRAKLYVLGVDEVRASEWIRHNSRSKQGIASTRTDLDLTDTINDESFYLYGAITQRRMISEGAKYGALLSAVADSDDVKGLHPIGSAQQRLSDIRRYASWTDSQYLIARDSVPDTTQFSRVFQSGKVIVWQRKVIRLL